MHFLSETRILVGWLGDISIPSSEMRWECSSVFKSQIGYTNPGVGDEFRPQIFYTYQRNAMDLAYLLMNSLPGIPEWVGVHKRIKCQILILLENIKCLILIIREEYYNSNRLEKRA